ncbi:MAG: multidrug efflux MFS transporter [Micrococcales bacterium]|nr:multidrug efflux MFS transporter [Micrococcales bacterium]
MSSRRCWAGGCRTPGHCRRTTSPPTPILWTRAPSGPTAASVGTPSARAATRRRRAALRSVWAVRIRTIPAPPESTRVPGRYRRHPRPCGDPVTNTIDLVDTSPPQTLDPRSRVAIVLLLVSVFVVFLNETVMSVAVPSIMEDLDITPSAGQWLTTAFALTAAIVVPVTGWLLQRLATRPVFVTAMSLFSIGTLIAAAAPTFGVLVLGRVVQASGTAIMMPLLMTTVLQLVPLHDRGRMMGRISIVMSVAPAIGPAVSGLVLTAFGSWRLLFWIVLPIAALMLAIGMARVPNISEPRSAPLDILSVVLSVLGFGGIVYGLSAIGAAAEGTAIVAPWIPLTAGVTALAAFVVRQLLLQRTDRALLDLRTFRSPTFTVAIVLFVVMMVTLFGMVIVLPMYVQRVLLAEPVVIGAILLPGGLIMGLIGPAVGRIYDRFGTRPLIVPGTVLVSAGLWGLAMLTETTPVWFILFPHVILSIGLGILFTALFTASTSALSPRLYSHGSATLTTLQQVAGAAGTAAFVALLAAGTAAAGGTDAENSTPAQVMVGVHWAFLTGAFISLAPIVIAFFVRKPAGPEISDPVIDDAAASRTA